jgi:hypothetical protein
MDNDYMLLTAIGITLLVVTVWFGAKSPRVMVSIVLLATQGALLFFGLDVPGRQLMKKVIDSGGPVVDVSEALMALKSAQMPHRIAILLCSLGLFLQVVFCAIQARRGSRGGSDISLSTTGDDSHPG